MAPSTLLNTLIGTLANGSALQREYGAILGHRRLDPVVLVMVACLRLLLMEKAIRMSVRTVGEGRAFLVLFLDIRTLQYRPTN